MKPAIAYALHAAAALRRAVLLPLIRVAGNRLTQLGLRWLGSIR
eukprot:gene3863-3708_t